jgi:hypothetical protein
VLLALAPYDLDSSPHVLCRPRRPKLDNSSQIKPPILHLFLKTILTVFSSTPAFFCELIVGIYIPVQTRDKGALCRFSAMHTGMQCTVTTLLKERRCGSSTGAHSSMLACTVLLYMCVTEQASDSTRFCMVQQYEARPGKVSGVDQCQKTRIHDTVHGYGSAQHAWIIRTHISSGSSCSKQFVASVSVDISIGHSLDCSL